MLERAKTLRILVASNRRSLDEILWALEALETGTATKTNYSAMKRAFHTIKHDARSADLPKLGEVAGACESIVERASALRQGLPLELLHSASKEIQVATETIAAGGRHQLDARLLEKLKVAAGAGTIE